MKKNTFLYIFLFLFILTGCKNTKINYNEKPENVLVPQEKIAEKTSKEKFTEYPFEECGKREKFKNYDWYKTLIINLSTIEISNNYIEDIQVSATEKDIADICFSKTSNRAVLIIHPPASQPNADRNQEWKVVKFFPETKNILVSGPHDNNFDIYADFVEFGKRQGNIIKIHTLDRWAEMYTKHEYDYNYIENILTRKISCSYDDRNPKNIKCF